MKAMQAVRKEKEREICIAPTSIKYMLTYFDCFARIGACFVKLMRNIWFKAVSEIYSFFCSLQATRYFLVSKAHRVNTSTSFDSVAPDV